MGNYRSPYDSSKEMESQDQELCRSKLHVPRVTLGGSPRPAPRQRHGKADNIDQTRNSQKEGERCTKEQEGQPEEKSSKKSSLSALVDTDAKNKTSSQGGVTKSLWKGFLSIGLIILGIAGTVIMYPYVMNRDKSDQFDNWFQQMEKDFPEQYDFTWQILNRSLKKFITDGENSTQPTIILMLGTGDNREIVNCLSDRVKTIVENVYDDKDCLGIKSKELVKSNDTFLKFEMEKNVTKKKCHALVIEDIDLLRAVGLNLLQAYCDHENAPHKTVTIILTATTKRKPPTTLPKNKYEALVQVQKMAREHLNDAWKTVGSDYRDAWLSRFMQYVVVTGDVSQPTACAKKNHRSA